MKYLSMLDLLKRQALFVLLVRLGAANSVKLCGLVCFNYLAVCVLDLKQNSSQFTHHAKKHTKDFYTNKDQISCSER